MFAGLGLGALVAAGLAVAPAIGAGAVPGRLAPQDATASVSDIGTFTPAAADPKLAALLARSGMDDEGFRFTPSDSRRARKVVTVAVRARSNRSALAAERAAGEAAPASVSLAPIAYNLGVAVGWKRFAVSSDIAKIDLAGQPGSRETVEAGVSYTGRKFSGRVKAASDKPMGDTPALANDPSAYMVDVGGSYSLTHNLDVTAGLRYRSERDRLTRIDDDRRDSQSFYIGTAFRF